MKEELYAVARTSDHALGHAVDGHVWDDLQYVVKRDGYQVYRITVEDITPKPEEPGWWYWDKEQKWVISFERQARIDVRNGAIESVVVHGTSDDRSEKAQSLFDAILKAGKP